MSYFKSNIYKLLTLNP